jgi:hypothetical protein
MVTPDGNPVGNTLPIIRARGANAVLAFGGGQYWAESLNGSPRPLHLLIGSSGVQFLRIDGTRVQGSFRSWWNLEMPPRIGFGNGRFCVLYPWSAGAAAVELFGRETIEEPLLNIRRVATNGAFFFVETVRGERCSSRDLNRVAIERAALFSRREYQMALHRKSAGDLCRETAMGIRSQEARHRRAHR